MDAERGDERWQGFAPWRAWIIAVPSVALLYVLSIGPAVLLRDSGRISQGTLLTVYAPIVWLTHFGPFNQVIEWYASLWSLK
jgi:hypothetical protein